MRCVLFRAFILKCDPDVIARVSPDFLTRQQRHSCVPSPQTFSNAIKEAAVFIYRLLLSRKDVETSESEALRETAPQCGCRRDFWTFWKNNNWVWRGAGLSPSETAGSHFNTWSQAANNRFVFFPLLEKHVSPTANVGRDHAKLTLANCTHTRPLLAASFPFTAGSRPRKHEPQTSVKNPTRTKLLIIIRKKLIV